MFSCVENFEMERKRKALLNDAEPEWDSLRYREGQIHHRYRRRALGEPPCQGKKRLKTCWKKVRLFQPGRHSVEDEVDGLVEDAGGLVELQLGLEVVVLALHVHDHGVQELDL